MKSLICKLFGHIPLLVGIKHGDVGSTPRTIPTKYVYECLCCETPLGDPFKKEDPSC